MSEETSLPLRATRAIVDLAALGRNVDRLVRQASPASVYAVVKADGYGHGAAAVARTALAHGARGLCVALPQEALALRGAGIDGEVLVLGPTVAAEMSCLAAAGVSVTVGDAEAVAAARAVADRLPAAARPLRVHLKVDTGMGRIGCRPEDAPDLARSLAEAQGIALDGVFTHLASADEDAGYTEWQIDRFASVRKEVVRIVGDPGAVLFHAANSAGALHYPAGRMDAIRGGIALYGYPGTPPGSGRELGQAFEPVLRLESRVSFVKRVPAGTAVSYGATHRTAGDRVLCTVPAGYADGVRRGLTGLAILVDGRPAPIVGRVTMDQLVVEGPPDWAVRTGAPVVLIGRGDEGAPTAADWAERIGTIPYEILTGLSGRVPRVYEGAP